MLKSQLSKASFLMLVLGLISSAATNAQTVFSSRDSIQIMSDQLKSELELKTSQAQRPQRVQKYQRLLTWLNQIQSPDRIMNLTEAELEIHLGSLANVLHGVQNEEIFREKEMATQLKKIKNIVQGQILLPWIPHDLLNTPLTERQINQESFPLLDPQTRQILSGPKEMLGLSAKQMGDLDVLESHPQVYSERQLKEIKTLYGSAWKYLEQSLENLVSQKRGFPYKLNEARRVLLFDEIKTTATSAKIDAKDLYGQGWKVKWSEEIHSEPIANRLAVELGAKFADPVYANSNGRADLILFLEAPSLTAAESDKVVTVAQLKKALLSSVYEFDLTPYISSSGTITSKNAAEILGHLKLSPEKIEKLLGRQFVTFNESLVEFQGDSSIVQRIGPLSLDSHFSRQDRAKRGFALFSYWIQNKDAKDDNTRSALVGGSYREFFHDLGASLASIFSSAHPNQIESNFLDVSTIPGSIAIQHRVLYVPKSFKDATTADLRWMARRILNLSKAELEGAVEASQWPQFQAQVLLSRLISRRNQISTVFQMNQPMVLTHANNEKRNLRTRQDRRDVAIEFKMDVAFDGQIETATDHLESVMKASGAFIDSNGISSLASDTMSVQRNGISKIKSCEESVIIAALESSSRPSGLSRRVKRSADDRPLDVCHPGMRNQN
jgi:hypothetical protein